MVHIFLVRRCPLPTFLRVCAVSHGHGLLAVDRTIDDLSADVAGSSRTLRTGHKQTSTGGRRAVNYQARLVLKNVLRATLCLSLRAQRLRLPRIRDARRQTRGAASMRVVRRQRLRSAASGGSTFRRAFTFHSTNAHSHAHLPTCAFASSPNTPFPRNFPVSLDCLPHLRNRRVATTARDSQPRRGAWHSSGMIGALLPTRIATHYRDGDVTLSILYLPCYLEHIAHARGSMLVPRMALRMHTLPGNTLSTDYHGGH